MVDTHCHLYLEDFNADRREVVDRALKLGVNQIYLPNIDAGSIESMEAVVADYPDICFPMMGLHPTSVKEDYREQMGVIEMKLRENPGAWCAVGEIGIDLYWDKTFVREQEDVFKRQLELAWKYQLPVAIHTRNSMDVTLEICTELRAQGSGYVRLSEMRDARCAGVFHCFSGNLKQAERAIELGYLLGIGGVVTFKNSGLQKVVEEIPLEYLVLETDAPFLAPVPYRGKRNEPAYIPLIASKIAELKNVSVEKVAAITTENARKIFGKK